MKDSPPPGASPAVPLTSVSLLARIKEHEAKAWQHLLHIYGPLVYHWCRRWELRPEDTADIFQEVFQAVAIQISNFRHDRPGASFRGWLWTITRNKVGDHFRRQGRGPVAVGGSDAQQRLLDIAEPPTDEALDAEVGGVAYRALEVIRDQFQERTWQMFWRVTVEGHATREVAAEMGVGVDAVRMARWRILRRLRGELAELGEG
jgi:RNA polymerase sigma-70 factor (ECF subfamily)